MNDLVGYMGFLEILLKVGRNSAKLSFFPTLEAISRKPMYPTRLLMETNIVWNDVFGWYTNFEANLITLNFGFLNKIMDISIKS